MEHKNTKERIELILEDFEKGFLDKDILRLELETLVLQAQMEQLNRREL